MSVFFGHIASNENDTLTSYTPSDWEGVSAQQKSCLLINQKHPPKKIGSYLISYNGEPVWLDSELCQLKKQLGLIESLAQAYKKSGAKFLNKLTGGFVIVIHDLENNKTFIAVDKMGIGRLTYQQKNGLSFSNSIKTLQQFSESSLNINQQAIYNYVYFHMIPSPDSFFDGIQKLEPAHFIEYSKGELTKTKYWEPTFLEETQSSTKQLSKKLHGHLKNAVRRSLSDGTTGAFLSGGLDSSTISGTLASFRSSPDTFTIGFNAEDYDETPYARLASRHFHTKHHEYFVTPNDVLDSVPKIAAAYDEPFGNSSAIPTYFCAKLAKENGCETLLAGDGGDELFAGNERYAKQKLFETYNKAPAFIHKGINAPYNAIPSLKNKRFFSKGYSFLQQAATPLPHRMENYNFLHQIAPETIFDKKLLDAIDTNKPINHLSDYYHAPEQASSLNRMHYMDWKRTLADNDLRKVSHMCELAGIDVRYPFLDSELVDFSCSIPSNMKLKGFKLRHFYKQAMKGFLPNEILTKSKHGFGLPFGVWMKTNKDLQALAYDNISALKNRGFFNPEFLDDAINQHKSGHASYYGELVWILMMLELWLQANS
ncbi:MAG: asparagine synthase [Piscirickettsiaceae bacterium]|nr:MAG: asparagine synthase [Piscirickettsiaceae bacterium]